MHWEESVIIVRRIVSSVLQVQLVRCVAQAIIGIRLLANAWHLVHYITCLILQREHVYIVLTLTASHVLLQLEPVQVAISNTM
jgi:hypothetical protein